MTGDKDLRRLLVALRPEVVPGEFVFVSRAGTPEPSAAAAAVATVREDEGTTYVLPRRDADRNGWAYEFVAGWITLRVHSALDAVGLTAAVAAALADAGISANVLAGFHHDHVLVPANRVEEAVLVLGRISTAAAG